MNKIIIYVSLLMALLFVACNIEQKKEAKLPDVDVEIQEGQLPTYDIDWVDIDAGTTRKKVKIPKMVVVMEEVEVDMPYIDFKMPEDKDYQMEERTIAVEAEVKENSHNLSIDEVIVKGSKLFVISTLQPTNENIKKERIRIADRIHINAPEDLDVKHYIIGKRPSGSFNQQYTYVSAKSKISNKLKGGKSIYKI